MSGTPNVHEEIAVLCGSLQEELSLELARLAALSSRFQLEIERLSRRLKSEAAHRRFAAGERDDLDDELGE